MIRTATHMMSNGTLVLSLDDPVLFSLMVSLTFVVVQLGDGDERSDDASRGGVGDPRAQPAELVGALLVQALRDDDAGSSQQHSADDREVHDQCFPVLMGYADGVDDGHTADGKAKSEPRDDEQVVQLTCLGGRVGLCGRVVHDDHLTFVSMLRLSGWRAKGKP